MCCDSWGRKESDMTELKVVITPIRGSSEKGQNKRKRELLGLSQDKASCPPGTSSSMDLVCKSWLLG